jgi:hypothetical protein
MENLGEKQNQRTKRRTGLLTLPFWLDKIQGSSVRVIEE